MTVSVETWMNAQASVLGSCLIDDRAASKIVFGLAEQDFCESYRAIYRTIVDLYTTGKPVDPITVLAVIGPQYKELLVQLMEITPTAANIDSYVEICKQQAKILRLREIGSRMAAIDTDSQGDALLAEATAQLTQQNDDDVWTLSQALHDWMKRYQKKPDYLDWFMPQLRHILRAEPSDYYVLGGRPSSGKSAFAIQAAAYWAIVCGKRVGFFSHETSREKLTDRFVCCAAGVSMHGMKDRTLTDEEVSRACQMAAKVAEAPLFLVRAAGKSPAQIRDYALHHRLDVVIVDYLQIMSTPGDSEYARVTEASMALHIMCQQYGIFCLALSQLSRGRGEKPTLEDLRSSGQIEQDADAVLFLHRLDQPDHPRELRIAKNKDGELGVTRLAFRGACQQFLYQGPAPNPVAPYDYIRGKFNSAAEESMAQLTMLPADTPVPFEEEAPDEE